MNKLFTKVATLCVGLAMAAGVGVAVGASHVGEVKATEAEAYKLDGMVQGTGTSYNGDNEVTQGGVKWIVNGNVNQTPWRIGGKNTNGLAEAGAIRKIWSQDAVTNETVSKVVVTTSLPASNSLSATSVELKVGTDKGASDTSTLSQSFGNSIVFECPSNTDWSGQYFEFDFVMPQNNTGTQKYFQVSSIVFYYESTTPRGTLEITNVPHIVKVGDKFTPSYIWTPEQGSSSTIVTESVAYTASDSEVLTKEGSTFTAAKAGFATVTLTATDSVSEEYVSVSHKVYVTNPYSFKVGDSVALCAPDVKQELSSISDASTPYGVGAEYSENPAGTFELEVQEGSLGGSFAFRNEAGFLSWSAGNSLKVEDGKTENSAWYVVVYDSYMVIKNCADDTREIWWNAGTPRFACYTNKTPETSGYNSVDLYILGGQPVEVKYEVSFYEGTTGSSSEYAEGAKVTIPQPTESLIPEGKAFDYWEHKETGNHYAPGEEFTVGTSSARFDAVYKDVEPVVTDWTDGQKAAFGAALDGFVPPYFGATVGEPTINENNVMYSVAGDLSEQAATYFADGWTNDGDYFIKQSTNGVINGGFYPDDNSTYFLFQFIADTPTEGWDSTMLGYFNTILHGVVPSYDESVKDLAYHPNYGVFYFVAADSDTAEAALATLCATWEYYSEGGFYYAYSDDQLGYARGSVYQMAADQFWAVLEYNQTAYDSDMEALFEQYLGFVPPFFSGFPTYVWHEGEFVCEYIIETSQLADQIAAYQDDIVNYYELTDLGSSSGNVFVYNGGTSGTYPATIYSYGAALSDGGALIVELYSMFDQYIGFNIYYQAQPVSIALSGNYKTVFEYGEAFSADGLVVTATMSDSSLLDVTEYAEFSGYNATVSGEQTITVTVGSVKTTYTVTVKEYVPVMTGIEVSKNPTKVEYEVGEEFDPSGIEVKAVYDVGDPKVVDLKDVSFSGFDSATVGEKTVTVSYGDFSTTIKVTVKKAAYTAEQFAEDFLAEIEKVCKGYDGKKNNKAALNNVWTKMSAYYNELSSEEKTKIANATPKADGDAIQRMLAFYNYACKKYGLTKFISTQKSSLVINSTETTNNNLPIIVIVASAIAAVTAIGVVIGLKRRKNLLVK